MSFTRRRLVGSVGGTLACLAAPHIARAATRRLRFAHNNSVTSVLQVGAAAFADKVAALSEGRLAVDVFANAQLGSEVQTMLAVRDGSLDAANQNLGPAADFVKDIPLIEMPYLFRDVAAARASFDGALGDSVAESLKQQSIVVAGWGELGMRHVTANKPVRTPADLKGLKIRVQISQPTLVTFNAMGAVAETLPFPQLTEALRTGRFEAEENPLRIIAVSKLNAVQSHLSLTGHVYSPSVIIVSRDTFEDLSPIDREVILVAGRSGAIAMRDSCDEQSRGDMDALRAAGMVIVEDVDHAAFQRAALEVRPKLSEIYGAAAMDQMRRVVS